MLKKTLFLTTLFLSATMSSVASAQAKHALPEVMEIVKTSGSVIVETIEGRQTVARKGMTVPHAAKIMVLEDGSVTGKYLKSECEITYRKNMVVNVREDAQCAAGVPVIDAAKYAKFGSAANEGCCVVRTITMPATKPVVTPTTTTATTLSAGTNYTPYILGGIAGIVLLSELSDDDDTPISR